MGHCAPQVESYVLAKGLVPLQLCTALLGADGLRVSQHQAQVKVNSVDEGPHALSACIVQQLQPYPNAFGAVTAAL